jgi:hypothetical protein
MEGLFPGTRERAEWDGVWVFFATDSGNNLQGTACLIQPLVLLTGLRSGIFSLGFGDDFACRAMRSAYGREVRDTF